MRGTSTRAAPRQGARPGGAALWALAAVVVALVLVFDVATIRSPRAEPVDLWDTWLYGAAMTGAAAVAILRAVRESSERVLWGTLGVALALYAVGDWVYVLHVQHLVPEPYPSIADGPWIAFYAVAALAVVGLVRAEIPSVPVSVWLDGLVVGLGTATVTAALSFDTIAGVSAGGAVLATVTTLAYPVADLVLLSIAAAAMAVQRWHVGPRWLLLATGILVFSGGDAIYVFRAATEGYVAGSWLDVSWPTGAVLMALAALTRAPEPATERRTSAAVVVVPIALSVLALGLLVAQQQLRLSDLSLVLAALTVLATLARIAITVGEVSTLATTRAQASTDELTGLANRRRFFAVLQRLTTRRSANVAVAVVDLDRFKEVNDSLGHDAGDTLLRAVAERLRAALGPRALVARLGGDEFAIVLDAEPGADAVLEGLRAALREVCQPVSVGTLRLRPSASAGVALAQGRLGDVDALMRRADSALYRAKHARGRVELAGAQDEVAAQSGGGAGQGRLRELRAPLPEGDVVVHVQPQVELATASVTAVELLARFARTGAAPLDAEELLTAQERAGLVPRLTRQVLDAALDARSRWSVDGPELRLSVNLSKVDLMDEDLVDVVASAMERHGVPAGALELEVDERSVAGDLVRAAEVLDGLRRVGAAIALDGFDVERSSLGPLNLLPLDTLKIVGPPTGGSDREERSRGAARPVVAAARSLGLRVVALGVDDAPTERFLRDIGCHAVQRRTVDDAMTVEDLSAHEHAPYDVADRSTETTRWVETLETAPDATSTTTTEPASIRSG